MCFPPILGTECSSFENKFQNFQISKTNETEKATNDFLFH